MLNINNCFSSTQTGQKYLKAVHKCPKFEQHWESVPRGPGKVSIININCTFPGASSSFKNVFAESTRLIFKELFKSKLCLFNNYMILVKVFGLSNKP